MALQINGPVTSRAIVKPSSTLGGVPIAYTDTGSNKNPGLSYTAALSLARGGAAKPPAVTTAGGTASTAPVVATGGNGGGNGGGGGGVEAVAVDPNQAQRDMYNKLLSELAGNNKKLMKSLENNYNTSRNTIAANYDLTQKQAEQASANNLREAYINYMMNKRNIANDLARAGMTGGLSESAQARMYNNYGTNRNSISNALTDTVAKINTERNAALNNLQTNYENNRAKQLSNYYDRRMNILKALAALG